MDDGTELWIAHLHLGSAELGTLVLLASSLASAADFVSTPSVALWSRWRVVTWRRRIRLLLLLRPLLTWIDPSYQLVLGILRRRMLPHTLATIALRYGHVHPILDVLLRLLRQLRLVSYVLCILESSCHAHDLCLGISVVVFFTAIVVSTWVADGLQLRTVVNCVDLDWAGNHLGGLILWAVLSDGFWWGFRILLATICVGIIHFFLNLGIVLILWAKLVYFSLKFEFVSFLSRYLIVFTLLRCLALLLHISYIKGWSLLNWSHRSSLPGSNGCALPPLVRLLLKLLLIDLFLLHPCWLGSSIQWPNHVSCCPTISIQEVLILSQSPLGEQVVSRCYLIVPIGFDALYRIVRVIVELI